MRGTFVVMVTLVSILFSCNNQASDGVEESCLETHWIQFCDDELEKVDEVDSLIEGVREHYKMGELELTVLTSYYSNNLYEYDVQIVPPWDTVRIKSLEENDIRYVVAESKNLVDLDYYRKYNVYFDSLNSVSKKVLKPRIPFSEKYICYIPEVNGSYKKNIGYCSITLSVENINSESDVKKFDEFVRSIRWK